MIRSIRALALAFVIAFALPAQAQAPAADPSVEEMVEALRMKPLTRSLKPGQPRPRGEGKLQLQVQFDYNSAVITPASQALLDKLAGAMKAPALSGLDYSVEGHTDTTGTGAGNLRLSNRRAQAVREYLAKASGLDAAKLTSIGMGSAKLADPANPTSPINRRVVIVSLEALPAESRTAGAKAGAGAGPDYAKESGGVVEQVRGQVQVRRGPSNVVVERGTRVKEGDVLTTGAGSAAMLRLDDGAKLLMRAESVLRIAKLKLTGDTAGWSQAFNLAVGAFRYVTGALGGNRPEAVAISTSYATVGIRGTDIDMVHAEKDAGGNEAGTYVKVNQGAVAIGGADGSQVKLQKDEQAFAGAKKPRTRSGAPVPAAVKLGEPSAVFQSGDFDSLIEGK
ncbi:MAG: OmpA family protein [Betaproteobacteria bacterium]|nr:OmpA family protein [Betaproteobacteria bacterium]